MNVDIYFSKVRESAIIPTKRDEDAGYDIYANFEKDYMVIHPHETAMIPTGIASCCSDDYCFILKERGSTGTKGIAQRCGVIDSGYRDEWFIPITNTTDKILYIAKKNATLPVTIGLIYPYEKAISQAIIVPVPKTNIHQMDYDKLKQIKSERGCGVLGSSGK